MTPTSWLLPHLLAAAAVASPVDCAGCGLADVVLCGPCRARLVPRPVGLELPGGTLVHAGLRYEGAVRDVVLALVSVIEALNSAGKALDRSVIARLGEHPDAEVFTSLPRSGQINAAQVLAEWGDCRPAYDSPDAVACLAGATPVTKQSGKHTSVRFR